MELKSDNPEFAGNATRLFSRPFLLSVLLLGVAAVLAGPIASWKDFRTFKEPIPLRTSLAALKESELVPYVVRVRRVLEPAVIEALGTTDYIHWVLEDPTASSESPLRFANLLVTYYTGGSNLVPHVPDLCYLGSGYTSAQPHETIDVNMGNASATVTSLPLRICTFAKTAVFNRDLTSVAYTFRCNNQYTASRNGVRLLTHQPGIRHAYFSKVEVSFPGASREESIEGAKKLFSVLLAVLERDHWPDFERAEREEVTSGSTRVNAFPGS